MRPPNHRSWAFAALLTLFTVAALGFYSPADATPVDTGHEGYPVFTVTPGDSHFDFVAVMDNTALNLEPVIIYAPYTAPGYKENNVKLGGETYSHKERDAI